MELEGRCPGTGVGAPEHRRGALWRLLVGKDFLRHLGIMANDAQPPLPPTGLTFTKGDQP